MLQLYMRRIISEEKLKMNTSVNIDNKRYIIFFLFVGLFSLWAFPGHSSIGQTEQVVIDTAKNDITNYRMNDYLDEGEIIHSKQAQTENKPTLPASVLTSKFIRQGPKDVKKVALTFDDGPYMMTDKYIDVLRAYDINAAFFLIGSQIEKYPEQAKIIIENGHEVAVHSYSHKQLSKMSAESIENDLQKSISIINNVAETDIQFFRPPFGDFNDTVIKTAKKHDLTTILWCVDPRDWQKDNPGQIVTHVLEKTDDGAIILLHEGREGTLKALPQIIEGLWEKGFEIVSLSELLSTM